MQHWQPWAKENGFPDRPEKVTVLRLWTGDDGEGTSEAGVYSLGSNGTVTFTAVDDPSGVAASFQEGVSSIGQTKTFMPSDGVDFLRMLCLRNGISSYWSYVPTPPVVTQEDGPTEPLSGTPPTYIPGYMPRGPATAAGDGGQQAQIFSAVRERDVDVLILEEFYSSSAFRTWWLEKMEYEAARTHSIGKLEHSLSVPGSGESDLVLRVANDTGDIFGMLVEVKIDARPQYNQASRYRERGMAGQPDEWKSFVTCVAAPKDYIDQYPAEAVLYDRRIFLEEIKEWFDAAALTATDTRFKFKSRLLDEAIHKTSRTTVLVPVDEVTEFWEDYARIARVSFGLHVSVGPKGRRSIRTAFHGQRQGQALVHHLTHGYVDLQLRGRRQQVERLGEINAGLLANDVKVTTAGGSAAFRITVPPLNCMHGAEAQDAEIRRALAAAVRLQEVGAKLRIDATFAN